MMTGFYIHIPFCIKKCGYCDFYSGTDFSYAEEYTNAVIREIKDFYDENDKIISDTVYFGGGTPTAIPSEFIGKILSEIKVTDDAEITIEANPKTFDGLKAHKYKEFGINRVSMGLQSANYNELELLGRIHNFNEFLNSYEILRKTGFNNINVDIMYGLPYSTEEKLSKTLAELKKLSCEHISAYALTLSENTPIYGKNYEYPTDDEVFLQYMLVNKALANYDHYEISNYAKIPARHNLKYWTNKPYIGFGAGAHSYFGNERWENISDVKEYIENNKNSERRKRVNLQIINNDTEYFEYIMLSLRLKSGIDLKYIKSKFSIDFLEKYKSEIYKNIEYGYLILENDRISLTEKGFFVSNLIISIFFD